jgi:hypothetical protein
MASSIRLVLLLACLACGPGGGGTQTGESASTSSTGITGTSTTGTGTTTGDTPTGSGSADASSGGTTPTGPDPTTGAVLTGTSGDTTTSTSTLETTGEPASTGDSSTGDVLPDCGGVDVAAIQAAFIECPDPGFLGQTASVHGVTCADICCAFSFAGCSHRAAQADFNACMPADPPPSGTCGDVFQPAWSSQCVCLD